MNLAALLLLIDGNGRQVSRSRAIRGPGRQARSLKHRNQPLTRAGGGKPQRLTSFRSECHPNRDRLAVKDSAIASVLLDRVGQGMAEIQKPAQTALSFVSLNDFGLDRTGALERRDHDLRIECQERLDTRFKPIKKVRIPNDGRLDEFCEARRTLTRGKRTKRRRV